MRTPPLTITLTGIMCLSACLASTASAAQSSPTEVRPLLSSEAYGRVLDRAFSHKGPKPNQLQFSIVLRLANEYIKKTGSVDVEQILKRVQTIRQTLPVSSGQAALWHLEFLKSLDESSIQLQQDFLARNKTGETTVFLDGSTYELWFDQGVTQVHWASMDEEVNDVGPAGSTPLAKWMNEIRRYALDHLKGQP